MKLRDWYAVHGRSDASPCVVAWLDSVRPPVAGLKPDFQTHDETWQEGVFCLESPSAPVVLIRRVLPSDDAFPWKGDDWEAELRAWDEKNYDYVIQTLRNAKQTVYLTPIDFTLGPFRLARVCEQLCGHYARATDGLIQVYQEGFFSSEGESLFPCRLQHRLKTR